ncbi:MAG TPA: DUF779 domain-containing protein [Solirubrobacteraceae bacterium]|nr:DUF779 domain-containing protein [Solirubrobacteraceae bacterium]
MQQPAHATGAAVAATRAALEVIHRLEAAHGPLIFFQSGGCCDGSAPMCLTEDDLPAAPGDLLLGRIGNAPFYIDGEQYERWRRPRFLIDVSPGAAEGFSLEGLEGVHFVTRTPAEMPDQPA